MPGFCRRRSDSLGSARGQPRLDARGLRGEKSAAGDSLWDFGVYGTSPDTLIKRAPLIETLVMNKELWELLLDFFLMPK